MNKRSGISQVLVAVLLFSSPVCSTFAAAAEKRATAAPASVSAPVRAVDADAPDLSMLTLIRQEGLSRSKVMEILSELTDVIGPRLTNSPGLRKANAATRDQLAGFGLENARLEKWGPFGRGWSFQASQVRMVAPEAAQLIALPKAWTPGTAGAVEGKAVRVALNSPADLEKYRGKLKGAVVLVGEPRELKPIDKPQMSRLDEARLNELWQFDIRRRGGDGREALLRRVRWAREVLKFLSDEQPLAVIEPSRSPGDGGTIFVQGGGSYRQGEPTGPPWLVMSTEHYNRIARLLERKIEVKLEVDVRTTFHDDDPYSYNTIAEIPGTDPALKDQVVMLGAHLDSWHGGTGATDNGAGVAVAMEAVRILKALEVKPRRTIRIALWTGEEQGLLGSRAYVAEHFAERLPSKQEESAEEQQLPSSLQRATGPLRLKPGHAKISAYFNLDGGTGRIRGVHLMENAAAAPIIERWIAPLRDLGVTTATMRSSGGSDHLSFDRAGIPAFDFVQDEIEYRTRTHHSNMDVLERILPEDLMQASVVMASFVYNAAMRDEMMPRKPLAKGEVEEASPRR